MKQVLRDRALKFLCEAEGHVHMDHSVIGSISNVDVNKEEDYIRIDFDTTYGQKASILTKYGRFKNWFAKFGKDKPHAFKRYVQSYLKVSEEQKQSMEEIVDGDGTLYGDGDVPPNGPNKMVGTSVWDLEKVYRSGNARSMRTYSGDLGIGIITW